MGLLAEGVLWLTGLGVGLGAGYYFFSQDIEEYQTTAREEIVKIEKQFKDLKTGDNIVNTATVEGLNLEYVISKPNKFKGLIITADNQQGTLIKNRGQLQYVPLEKKITPSAVVPLFDTTNPKYSVKNLTNPEYWKKKIKQ